MKATTLQPNTSAATLRHRLIVEGVVQGVGFRPFVYRLARELSLGGWVENTAQGVIIEVEGPAKALELFSTRLRVENPALSSIRSCNRSLIDVEGPGPFEIRHSRTTGRKSALVLPDIATCPQCLSECLNPHDRRFRYPFTNCTHCGPRFSIIESLPYDRPNTSMKGFAMCPDCRREYENPTDRRFHAQPVCCPVCGPQLQLWNERGHDIAERDAALIRAARAVLNGHILALKGLGGFQLIVDARNEDAVRLLRRRKRREEKPFALMVGDPGRAEALCDVTPHEQQLLTSPQAPIVLLRRRDAEADLVAPGVAPGNPYLGVMLPYTPLHYLLLREIGRPVVATSGNLSDEPICTDEHEALERLGGIAEFFLIHDRPIVRHVDDSIVRTMMGRPVILRRARGYAPLPVDLATSGPTILAVGAHQKNTVTLAVGARMFTSQHIGDLVTPQSFAAFERSAADLPSFYEASPSLVACDLHPDYLSSKHADGMTVESVRVQHHHAHVVSCMVDNAVTDEVLGVSWDGTGLGTDRTIWGGEFLRATCSTFERFAHLGTFPLPGGERAATEPRRSALGILYATFGDIVFDWAQVATVQAFKARELSVLSATLRKGRNAVQTSSAGRLFDAVASLLGLRQRVQHEGQAAMELEFAAASSDCEEAYPFQLLVPGADRDAYVVDWRPLVRAILVDIEEKRSVATVARIFHNTLAAAIVAVAQRSGERRILLTGGCFQNRLLTESTVQRITDAGLEAYWHKEIPPNDGGVSFGQAAVARAVVKER